MCSDEQGCDWEDEDEDAHVFTPSTSYHHAKRARTAAISAAAAAATEDVDVDVIIAIATAAAASLTISPPRTHDPARTPPVSPTPFPFYRGVAVESGSSPFGGMGGLATPAVAREAPPLPLQPQDCCHGKPTSPELELDLDLDLGPTPAARDAAAAAAAAEAGQQYVDDYRPGTSQQVDHDPDS